MPDHDDHELERIMREGLHSRAEEAPGRLASGPPTIASRRRSPVRVVGLAAAAVALAVGLPLALQGLGDGPTPAEAPTPPIGVSGDWRVESYDGIQVRVPPDWGWGGAPFHAEWSGGDVLDCGVAPFVVPGSADYESVPEDAPYVGRPVMMTDACLSLGAGGPERPVRADSVWLGAAVEPGTEQLDGGYVQETVAVGDSVVTVTSDDPALRRAILATAEAVEVDDNGCRAGAAWTDFPDGPLPDVAPESLSVCQYDGHRGGATLLWSARQGPMEAREYARRVQESSALFDPNRLCTEQPDGQWLAIGVHGADGGTAWTAVSMGECAQVLWHHRARGDPESLAASPVSPSTVEPWAVPWVRAYVAGPSAWEEYAGVAGRGVFRGYLG